MNPDTSSVRDVDDTTDVDTVVVADVVTIGM
jgi:hypothetical protein